VKKGITTVREFDTITFNELYRDSEWYKFVEERYFNELETFIMEYTADAGNADILDFLKVSYKRNVGKIITFKNYVGIIELPSGYQIEILPKIDLDEETDKYSETKKIFCNMLRCLEDFDGKIFKAASLDTAKMGLYEIFIKMYIVEARRVVKHGLKSNYSSNEDNLRFYKGKLNVSQQIRLNAAHKERFYMQYDEYQLNRPENRIVKTTLLYLQKKTASESNAREIRQLLWAFELVDVSYNIDKDFASVNLGRDTSEYTNLIAWSGVFLKNKSFTSFSGSHAGTALLFPMEKVFEDFVAIWVKRIFAEESEEMVRVSAQDKGHFLFDSPKRFRIRPDLVAKKGDTIIVLDTKWKRLKDDISHNYGISQADMYQMYAYAKKYDTENICLIYPLHDEVKHLSDISFTANEKDDEHIKIKVFFVDLKEYKTSLKKLYEEVAIK